MTPKLSIPPPLKGNEDGTWAQSSIVNRLPEILERTRIENDFSFQVEKELQALANEIPGGPIRHLRDEGAPDLPAWRKYITPHVGRNWLEVPWFFVEHYFYRRIMEAVGYFQGGHDPFQYEKEKGTAMAITRFPPAAASLARWVSRDSRFTPDLKKMIYLDLWGNQADLSLWPSQAGETPDHASLEEAQPYLLADDSDRGLAQLTTEEELVVDVIIDNAGYELVLDLALADLLLSQDWAKRIRFHAKAHPTFVSDAVIQDVRETILELQASEEAAISSFGDRVAGHLDQGRLSIHDHYFWNSPLAFWEMPEDVDELLEEADLLISKGDANYRRLVGDRHWPFDTPFNQVVDYLPTPVLALRTLKAEVVVGISEEKMRKTKRRDGEWMVDGRWGVIQFAG